MYNYGRKEQKTYWKDAFNEYKNTFNKAIEKQGIMTEFERQSVAEYLREQREQVRVRAIPGAVQEFNNSVEYFKARQSAEHTARAKEISRWDSANLFSEMQVAQMRLNTIFNSDLPGDDKLKAVKNLYAEAAASGNSYKKRAAAEQLLNVTSQASGDVMEKLPFNSLRTQAENDLENIRMTDELRQAQDNKMAAANEVYNKVKELDSIANTFHGGNATAAWEPEFAKALGQVEFGVSHGELIITVREPVKPGGSE